MTLSFPAHRRGEVRLVGGLIDEALRRGHQVHLLWRHDDKPGEGLDPDDLRRVWPRAVISPTVPHGARTLIPLAALYNQRADVSLDYCLNHLHARPAANVGLMTFASDWERQAWERLARTHWKSTVSTKTVVTGDAALDGLALCDPLTTRTRYHFGQKPVVVFFALKFGLPGNYWRRYWYKHIGYWRTLYALKGFCERIGAELVIKSRRKHKDPLGLNYLARVIFDEDLYPSTAHRLISCASLIVHYQSGACYEAAAAGVPQVAIRLPHPHLKGYAGTNFLFGEVPMHSSNAWPGVVESISAAEAPRYFQFLTGLPGVEQAQRKLYVEKLMGFDDFRSSARVLDAVGAI